MFFLDDEDRALVGQRRGEHMRLGFALQLVTVRWLGTFLEDPLDVPGVVLEFVAGQLGVEDPSLLPGVTTLARLVAKVRDETAKRLWGVLEGLLTIGQRYILDQLLAVPPGSRVSDLERWRKGAAPRASGPASPSQVLRAGIGQAAAPAGGVDGSTSARASTSPAACSSGAGSSVTHCVVTSLSTASCRWA